MGCNKYLIPILEPPCFTGGKGHRRVQEHKELMGQLPLTCAQEVGLLLCRKVLIDRWLSPLVSEVAEMR